MEENKIYCGNCIELMKELPEKSIDLCITDIPFNVNWKYGEYKDNLSDEEYYQNCIIWFREMARISKRVIVKIPTKFSYLVIPAFHKECGYLWTVIQYSPNTTSHGKFNLNLYTQYLISIGEGKKPGKDLFINTKNDIKTDHPAEMPVNPIKTLLKWFSEPRALILDPFMGSGTTAEACLRMDRRFIGFELNKDFVDLANNRIKELRQQQTLNGFALRNEVELPLSVIPSESR